MTLFVAKEWYFDQNFHLMSAAVRLKGFLCQKEIVQTLCVHTLCVHALFVNQNFFNNFSEILGCSNRIGRSKTEKDVLER